MESPVAALKKLDQMSGQGAEVAQLIAGQWMPDMTGIEFLRRAQVMYAGPAVP